MFLEMFNWKQIVTNGLLKEVTCFFVCIRCVVHPDENEVSDFECLAICIAKSILNRGLLNQSALTC